MTDPKCPFCSTPLSEHEARGCLDAWAARVVGWVHIYTEGPDPFSKPWGWSVSEAGCREMVPRYSQDIAAAMELVSPNRHFRLTQINDAFNTGEPWQVELAPQIVQCADTPAHAITKAFIAAKQRGYRRPQP